MNTIYFISYCYKGKWGKYGFGSGHFEIAEPITEKNFDILIHSLKGLLKVKTLVILTYKELKGGEG